MSYRDLAAVAQLVETEEEKSRIQQIINQLAKETLRGNLTAHWWLPLESVSFASIDEVSAGKEEKLYVNALACVDSRHSFSNYLTIELLALEEMTRALAHLFHLTLPVPPSVRQNGKSKKTYRICPMTTLDDADLTLGEVFANGHIVRSLMELQSPHNVACFLIIIE